MPSRMVIVMVVLTETICSALQAAEPLIVENGVPKAVVVLSAIASDKERQAAELLVTYVEKMSGARLQIVTPTEACTGPRIIIGRNRLQRTAGISVAQGPYPLPERIIIRRRGSNLYLLGNDAGSYDGTYFAVCTLLDHLGVRWYWPGELGEVVPRRITLELLNLNLSESPDFPFRLGPWSAGGVEPQDGDFGEWKRHNRLGGARINAGHNLSSIIPPAEYFNAHPEWFALIDGERVPNRQPCTSHPEVRRLAIEAANKYFADNPDAAMFSLAQNDGAGYCECPLCTQGIGGNVSDRLVDFCNAVSEGLKPEYKDKLLAFMAYDSKATDAPVTGLKARPNLICSLIHYSRACPLHSISDPNCSINAYYRKLIEDWSAVVSRFIWSEHDNDSACPLPVPRYRVYVENIRALHQSGALGYLEESLPNWPAQGLGFYLSARLLWNTEVDTDALAQEFFHDFFGPAASAMQHFYEKLDELVAQQPCRYRGAYVLPPAILETVWPELMEAERLAAAGPPQLKERIARVRGYFELCRKLGDFFTAKEKWQQAQTPENWQIVTTKATAIRDYVDSLAGRNILSRYYFRRWFDKRAGWFDPAKEEQVAARLAQPEILLLNSSFERDENGDGVPDEWQRGYTYYGLGAKVSYNIIEGRGGEPRRYLRIQLAGKTAHTLRSPRFQVKPECEYRLLWRTRGKKFNIIRIFLIEYDAQETEVSRRKIGYTGPRADWCQRKELFTTGKDTCKGKLELYISTIGNERVSDAHPAYVDLADFTLDEGF